MNLNRFLTHSIRQSPYQDKVLRILGAALQAVDPYDAVSRALQRTRDGLCVEDQKYPLSQESKIFIVGAGKAAVPMTQAVVDLLEEVPVEGCIITKEGHAGGKDAIGPVLIHQAGHPLPDQRGVAGTQAITELLTETKENDLVVCLISGGGSALLTYPVPGVTLEDMRMLTGQLLACGATINQINTLRKHLSQVKGGQLARIASPASVVTLILSDVVGNPLEIIASGPTVPDPNTFAEAWDVLDTYGLTEIVPTSIRNHLESGMNGERPETPKPGDPLFGGVQNVLVGSNERAAEAGQTQAEKEGFHTTILTTSMQGEARERGFWFANLLKHVADAGEPLVRPCCLIAGGETTVTLRGNGMGGRNQEMALATVPLLADLEDAMLITLATDGGDGPTDAAGAVVTSDTLRRAARSGLDPNTYLRKNDSYSFFDPMGDLLRPGPTQTNVNDLVFGFLF